MEETVSTNIGANISCDDEVLTFDIKSEELKEVENSIPSNKATEIKASSIVGSITDCSPLSTNISTYVGKTIIIYAFKFSQSKMFSKKDGNENKIMAKIFFSIDGEMEVREIDTGCRHVLKFLSNIQNNERCSSTYPYMCVDNSKVKVRVKVAEKKNNYSKISKYYFEEA